eukprot:scaffold129820_cov28-Attheya_sp.AAC.1
MPTTQPQPQTQPLKPRQVEHPRGQGTDQSRPSQRVVTQQPPQPQPQQPVVANDHAILGSSMVQTSSSSSKSSTSSVAAGWRVKLYRLNADGSWDDCGTGRIVCLFRHNHQGTTEDPSQSQHQQQQQQQQGTDETVLQRELGEPTLCMHSEPTATSSSSSPHTTINMIANHDPTEDAAVTAAGTGPAAPANNSSSEPGGL